MASRRHDGRYGRRTTLPCIRSPFFDLQTTAVSIFSRREMKRRKHECEGCRERPDRVLSILQIGTSSRPPWLFFLLLNSCGADFEMSGSYGALRRETKGLTRKGPVRPEVMRVVQTREPSRGAEKRGDKLPNRRSSNLQDQSLGKKIKERRNSYGTEPEQIIIKDAVSGGKGAQCSRMRLSRRDPTSRSNLLDLLPMAKREHF